MKRISLFEFEDFSRFPNSIRAGGTDYLRYFLLRTELYQPSIKLIQEVLNHQKENQLLDLCSGGGGYMEQVSKVLNKENNKVKITLNDKFPNTAAFEMLRRRSQHQIDYLDSPVDVFQIPSELKGIRVMYSALHHFSPNQVKSILQNTVNAKASLCIFDGERNLLSLLGILLIHPFAFILFTPFFKPFTFPRIFFTYILPLIPLYTIWDGLASVLRMYEPHELEQIVKTLDANNYTWKIGKTKNRFGLKSTYLLAYPTK